MATKLSVWLVPSPHDAARLEPRLERCSQALDSPRFAPHVTMCSEPGVTTLAAVGQLSELPLLATFSALAFGDDYHHGCYLRADDDSALRAVQGRCVAALGGTLPRGYPPHLSLAYGVLSDEQRATAATLVELPMPIRFHRLELWETSGPVESWRKLA